MFVASGTIQTPGLLASPLIFAPPEAPSLHQWTMVEARVSQVLPAHHGDAWRAKARLLIKDLLARGLLAESHLAICILQRADPRYVDIVCINLLMSAYKRRMLLPFVAHLFNQVRMSGVQPDGVSFNIVIDAYGKARDLHGAFAVMLDMRAAGWPPTVSTYTSLIDACGKANELDHAEQLMQQMQFEGVAPNACTYTSLVQACCKAHEFDRALRILDLVFYNLTTAPSIAEYCPTPFVSLIRACTEDGDVSRAFKALSLMTTVALTPDPITLQALLELCVTLRKGDLALDVFRVFRSCDLQPRKLFTLFSRTLELLGEASDLTTAYELLLMVAESKWSVAPSPPVSVFLLRRALEATFTEFPFRIEFALHLLPAIAHSLRACAEAAGRPTAPPEIQHLLAKLIGQCAGDRDRVLTALGYYVNAAGATPDKGLYTIVLSACGQEADLFPSLVAHDALPKSAAAANALLEACADARAFICAHATLMHLLNLQNVKAGNRSIHTWGCRLTSFLLDDDTAHSSAPVPIVPEARVAGKLLSACTKLLHTHESLATLFSALGVPVDVSPISITAASDKWSDASGSATHGNAETKAACFRPVAVAEIAATTHEEEARKSADDAPVTPPFTPHPKKSPSPDAFGSTGPLSDRALSFGTDSDLGNIGWAFERLRAGTGLQAGSSEHTEEGSDSTSPGSGGGTPLDVGAADSHTPNQDSASPRSSEPLPTHAPHEEAETNDAGAVLLHLICGSLPWSEA